MQSRVAFTDVRALGGILRSPGEFETYPDWGGIEKAFWVIALSGTAQLGLEQRRRKSLRREENRMRAAPPSAVCIRWAANGSRRIRRSDRLASRHRRPCYKCQLPCSRFGRNPCSPAPGLGVSRRLDAEQPRFRLAQRSVTTGPGREPIATLDASVLGNEADLAWSRSPV